MTLGHEGPAVHEQPFPDPDVAADIEWERHVVIARLAGHRRQRLQVGEQIAHVFDLRMLVGRVGKGRKIMRAVGRSPLQHRAHEFRLAPPADAVGRIGRNVWGRRRSRTAKEWRARRRGSRRSGWLGTAWQEEHPPALNVVRPLAGSACEAEAQPRQRLPEIVSHQKMPTPTAPANITPRRIRRSIHRSVISRGQYDRHFASCASMKI